MGELKQMDGARADGVDKLWWLSIWLWEGGLLPREEGGAPLLEGAELNVGSATDRWLPACSWKQSSKEGSIQMTGAKRPNSSRKWWAREHSSDQECQAMAAAMQRLPDLSLCTKKTCSET